MQCDDTFSLPPTVAIAISRLRQQGVEPIVAGGVAAQHWGMDSVGPIAPAILLAPSDRGVRPGFRSGVLIRHADLSQSHVVTGPLGLPFTTPVRTGIDCARGRDPLAAFIIVNSAARVTLGLRAGGIRLSAHEITDLATDPDVRAGMQDLVRGVLSECRGHGLASIKAGVHLIEPRLETALESLSWWRFSEAGLTMPVPQQWVQGASGEMYRVDFDCGHVVGEADGRVKYANPQVLWEEKRRQTDIERGGHPVVRWIWDDMWRHPEQVIRTLR